MSKQINRQMPHPHEVYYDQSAERRDEANYGRKWLINFDEPITETVVPLEENLKNVQQQLKKLKQDVANISEQVNIALQQSKQSK